jgi:putative N-acetyltransferase (TIGR04045 family)
VSASTSRLSATVNGPAATASGSAATASGSAATASGSAATASGRAATANGPAARPLLTCRPAASAAELAAHFRIRRQVFVVEQRLFGGGAGRVGRPGEGPGDDRDARDEDPATIHVVGLADGEICGTVRLYPLDRPAGQWQGDRLAVLAGHRRHGIGAPLVRYAVALAGARGGMEMEAFIQPANVGFFEGLGWRRAGDIVIYAGIDHQRMVIGLRSLWMPHGRPAAGGLLRSARKGRSARPRRPH